LYPSSSRIVNWRDQGLELFFQLGKFKNSQLARSGYRLGGGLAESEHLGRSPGPGAEEEGPGLYRFIYEGREVINLNVVFLLYG